MIITHSNCLVCNNTNINLSFTASDHFVSNETFQIYKCRDCGFVFTQNIPSPESMAPYYKSEEYISHSNTQKGIVNKLYHSVRKIMLARKYKLIKKLSPGKTLLDIGCGTGYFPYYMKTKGYTTFGMELDDDARKFAADNFQLEVEAPNSLLKKKQTNKYDIITLWHVLEHLHDADGYISWIHDSLNSNGVLLIALPNFDSYDATYFKEYWAAYDVPRHLWHFRPQTFEKYLTKFGFELQKIKRMPFDAYYNSLLSARYKGSKMALLSGFVIGFISNLKSFFNPNTASSVIYLLRKK